MKRYFTLLALSLLCVVQSFAYDAYIDGIYYNFNNTQGTAEVTFKSQYYSSEANLNAYQGDVVIPSTVDYNNRSYNVIKICQDAFFNCPALTSVEIHEGVTMIALHAFYDCSSLSSITIPESMTSIADNAFVNCSSLSSIYINDFAALWKITGWRNLFSSGALVYINGEVVTDVVIEEGTTSIPDYAFQNIKNIQTVSIPSSVTSIGSSAFANCTSLVKVTMEGLTPPAVTSSTFGTQTSIVVPDAAYNVYTAAWTNYVNQITIASQCEREVTVTAQDAESAIHKAVGEENLRHVLSLKVNGSINGYDIMVMRNKMINLHNLDLSNATIVGNDYEYYTGCHTSDNEVGPYAFYNLKLFCVKLPEVTTICQSAFSGCSNLREVTLPQSLTAIQYGAFSSCSNLREINLPESLTTLAEYAFSYCTSLSSVEIPGGVETIGSSAFRDCRALKTLTLNEGLTNIRGSAFFRCKITDIRFPESLTTINSYAFYGNSFEEVNLPPNLNTIGQYAFQDCSNLRVVRLNPMLKNIADNTFNGCSALTKVYTYTLEPTDILQNTFSTYQTADLYVPTPSYYTYYYNTQWSQFLSVNKTDEEYDFKSFYITKDYEMDDNTGILGGDPDAELNENSGLINSGSETQELGTVTIRFNGNNGSASIIANGNLTAEKIKVEITVTGNKWHFFCFPFDVPLSGVSTSGNKAYVFRHYNAEKRATGASGWENLPADQEVLKAGEGYIFQANGNTTLTVEVDNKTTFVGENVAAALKVQDAANVANASWNFTGNPGYAYFDIDDLGFSAPITVWDPNTNNYVALRPGDDDAFLHPFQAFFVQKPEGTDALTFNAEDRTTYLASQKEMARKLTRRRAASTVDNPRKLINLVLTDGQTTDKTRVVFNDEKSMAYEMECDAAKFASTGVPQLYSLDGNNTHYSINERPYGDGTVRLGFTANKAGHFSIEAQRMDANCYLRDLVTGVTHDLRTGAYDFESKEGTFECRFMLVNADVTDGLKSVNADEIAEDAVIYDLQGRRVQRAQRGVFVINGKKLNVK